MAPDVMNAKKWLEIAIRRHERHMAGKEPTDGKEGVISQKLMMEEMMYAKQNLDGSYISTTSWYDDNIWRFMDMPNSGM